MNPAGPASPLCVEDFTSRFAANAVVLRGLAQGVSEEQARLRPAPRRWSMLEVMCHLLDEEREDFRVRLDLLLHDPGHPWPGIDPEGWVIERAYNERSLAETMDAFTAERERSIRWLEGLADPAWDHALEHPAAGELQAGSMLAAWLDHDYLHMRQLMRMHHEQLLSAVTPYNTDYAGSW